MYSGDTANIIGVYMGCRSLSATEQCRREQARLCAMRQSHVVGELSHLNRAAAFIDYIGASWENYNSIQSTQNIGVCAFQESLASILIV